MRALICVQEIKNAIFAKTESLVNCYVSQQSKGIKQDAVINRTAPAASTPAQPAPPKKQKEEKRATPDHVPATRKASRTKGVNLNLDGVDLTDADAYTNAQMKNIQASTAQSNKQAKASNARHTPRPSPKSQMDVLIEGARAMAESKAQAEVQTKAAQQAEWAALADAERRAGGDLSQAARAKNDLLAEKITRAEITMDDSLPSGLQSGPDYGYLSDRYTFESAPSSSNGSTKPKRGQMGRKKQPGSSTGVSGPSYAEVFGRSLVSTAGTAGTHAAYGMRSMLGNPVSPQTYQNTLNHYSGLLSSVEKKSAAAKTGNAVGTVLEGLSTPVVGPYISAGKKSHELGQMGASRKEQVKSAVGQGLLSGTIDKVVGIGNFATKEISRGLNINLLDGVVDYSWAAINLGINKGIDLLAEDTGKEREQGEKPR